MPIPKPTAVEAEQEFISRCMGDNAMQEYEQEQRTAICYRQWKEKDKKLEELSEVKDGLVRIAIAYTGNFERGGKPFSITHDDLKAMEKQLRDREVPLDYEHLSAKPDAPPGHSIASGWLKAPDKIEDFSNGRRILWGWAEFTPASLSAIRKREYKYFSPEIHWNDEDEKGTRIGTRLAAGALTNRPFLKDLPPIEIGAKDFPQLLEAVALSDLERLINVGDAHVPADVNTSNRKDPNMKNLKVKPLTSGDNKGKHGIFDGEEMIGLADDASLEASAKKMHAEDLEELEGLRKLKKSSKMEELDELKKAMAELKAKHMEELKGSKKMDDVTMAELEDLRKMKAKRMEEMAELEELRKLKARTAKGGDLYIKHDGDDDEDEEEGKKMRGLTELVRSHRRQQQEMICLTEFAKAKPGDETEAVAEKLLASEKLDTLTFVRQQKISRLVDTAITKGKALPKQRQTLYELAIKDYDRVAALLNEAPVAVDLKNRGIEGDNDVKDAAEELQARVTQCMSEKKMKYTEALLFVSQSDPELYRRYQHSTRTMTADGGTR